VKSKERILAALNHQTTDRIPISNCHGFWNQEILQSLKTRYKIRGDNTLESILNLDVKWVEPVYCGPDLGFDDQGHPLGIWGYREGLETYTETYPRPLKDVNSIQQIEIYQWPRCDWFDFSTIPGLAKLYRDYAVAAPIIWSPIFSRISSLLGFETALIYLHTEPVLIEAMVEKITEYNCEFYANILDAAPGLIDILFIGDDPAGQERMLMNPDIWRRFFKPSLKKVFEIAKSRDVLVMYHICGNCREIIPDLIDIGMDILMPLQISARDMDPVELKEQYGRDISFWGGVDVQNFLPNATPDQVRTEVRRLIDILGNDGGYVLSSSHNLLEDIPIDNILAMFDEANLYYPYT